MTEAEARTKFCPMGFDAKYPHLFAKPDGKCKASDCMLWRTESVRVKPRTVSGYCGLGGQP